MSKKEKYSSVFLVILYFGLRIAYWITHAETPFSDMEDYVRIGQQIVQEWNFAHFKVFWLSYKPPVLPLFLALYFKLRGSFAMDFWPLFQTLFHFGSLIFLVSKIRRLTGNAWIAGLTFLIFAVSTSSIFWSFKPSTEYLSEAFILFLGAFGIQVLEKRTAWHLFFLGFWSMTAVLLRPQFLPYIPIFLITALAMHGDWALRIKRVILVLLGLLIVWLPWGVRTYRLYDAPILTSTQGPYSFLWELGSIEYTNADGEKVVTDVTKLQIAANRDFKNDYEAMRFANSIAKEWLKNNFIQYLEMIPRRIWNSITDKSEPLTHLPRNELFPPSIDWILLDKNTSFVVAGILGLLVSLYLQPLLWPVAILPIAQWLMGTAFLGYPRMIDSALPFLYVGNLFLFLFLKDFLQRKRRQSACNA